MSEESKKKFLLEYTQSLSTQVCIEQVMDAVIIALDTLRKGGRCKGQFVEISATPETKPP